MLDRRQLLRSAGGASCSIAAFHLAAAGLAQETGSPTTGALDADMIRSAEWVGGIELTEEERAEVAASLTNSAKGMAELRSQELQFEDLPAVHFQPLSKPADNTVAIERAPSLSHPELVVERPANEEDIAFLPVTTLARLLQTRVITSTELTQIYLARLKKYNSLLNCVVTLTEDLALQQASQADAEIAAGKYRGPLHGIPWGAKDLIAVAGYPTTWGIPQFETRELKSNATVYQRLEQAGAVLVAKLSLGAIAMGDKWFRGMTRCPWNYELGSSGSSAGSASATAAGLVGFSLGSETLGSIVSPSRRCGTTGFRPTFGRVSRAGCMSLSWSMDKIGPITRSVEDCALVFSAIHGYDGVDPTATDREFTWPSQVDLTQVKVGYVPSKRDDETSTPRADLEILRQMGCQIVPVELPAEKDQWALANVIDIEAASVFDQMLRDRQTDGWNTWPRTFRDAQFYSALDYLRLLRRRRQLQFKMEDVMSSIDFLIDCDDLLITNLTGHPTVVLPDGFREDGPRKLPKSTMITGQLNGDDQLLAFAQAFQSRLTTHLARPPLDEQLTDKAAVEDTPP